MPVLHGLTHLFSCSEIKRFPFPRSLKSVHPIDLRRGRSMFCLKGSLEGYFLTWIHLRRRRLLLLLLLFIPLFLAKELPGLPHHPGLDAMPVRVTISGALVAGIPGVLLGTQEAFPRGIILLSRMLRNRAGIFPALLNREMDKWINPLIYVLVVCPWTNYLISLISQFS